MRYKIDLVFNLWYNIGMILGKDEIKNLKDKKFRKQNGLFMVEGDKFCRDLLATDIKIAYTFTSKKDLDGFPNVVYVSDKVLSSIATTKNNQDIICICKIRDYGIESMGNSLILDNIQDPGNVGTLIRSALAFGFEDIYVIDGADVFGEKVVRSSAGQIMQVRLHICDYETIKQNKDKISNEFLVADMSGEDVNRIRSSNSKIAVIVGNEGNGVSDEMLSIADKVVAIPMSEKVESLNVGVAGSIIMQKFSKI